MAPLAVISVLAADVTQAKAGLVVLSVPASTSVPLSVPVPSLKVWSMSAAVTVAGETMGRTDTLSTTSCWLAELLAPVRVNSVELPLAVICHVLVTKVFELAVSVCDVPPNVRFPVTAAPCLEATSTLTR